MKTVLYLFIFSVIFSCSSQKNITEFIQLRHSNAVMFGGDELTITLIPTQKSRRRSVIIKTFRGGENFDRKRISYKAYIQIWDAIKNEISKKPDSSKNQNYLFGVIDGGSNSILLKRDTIQQEFNNDATNEEQYKKFYEVAEPILKAAGLTINDID